MQTTYDEIVSNFEINEEIIDIQAFGSGHINDTFLIVCPKHKYILQKINHNVFKKPFEVMENICNVSKHIRKKIIEKNGNPYRECMNFVKASNGTYLCTAYDSYFRMYVFIDDVICYQKVENEATFKTAGKAFGDFQKMLSDFPAETLHETIKDFHNTKERLNQLEEAVSKDVSGRAKDVLKEIEFARSYKNEMGIITEHLSSGDIPLRVTHNDTKLNNILIGKNTNEVACVIDLDTVMPSTLLFDFGDAIRFGATTAAEDEADLSKVNFDLSLFKAFAEGFLGEVKNELNDNEIKYMALAAKIMTLECGMRFLADYINNDVYFKTNYDTHNLDRARNQFKLVTDMEKNMDNMNKIVYNICK